MSDDLIRLSGITRAYGRSQPALDSVDLSIYDGEALSIVGRSGSGKSTLLNIIGLLDVPDSGEYALMGRSLTGYSEVELSALRAHYFGFVFQAFHLIGHRTVLENVELGALYLGRSRKGRKTRAAELLVQLGLEHRMTALPNTLSGGERQRVAIARALMGEPRLLLCDEPTGNLDTGNAELVMSLIKELNLSGITTITVTHDESVARAADRRIVIQDGRVVEHASGQAS